jgi:hypothetical protein
MHHKAVRYAFYSQLCLFIFLLICTLLMPHFLFERNEGGVSNYGVHALTILPYTLAYGLSAILMIRSALFISKKGGLYTRMRQTVMIIALLYLIVLISTYPYKINHTFDVLHIYLGIVLFIAETAAAVWFALVVAKTGWNRVLLSIQLMSSIALLLTLVGYVHILFVAEIAASLAFGALFVTTTADLVKPHQPS